MENPILSVFIFVIVAFLYIHVVAQWKKSEDLEIYETDYTDTKQFQEVIAVRQPVLFLFQRPVPMPIYESIQFARMAKYGSYNVKIKDMYDYWKPSTGDSAADSVDAVILPFGSARSLCESDAHSRYVSENNSEFLEETGLERAISSMDEFLKPPFCMYSKHDLMFGAKHAATPMRYHTSSAYFVIPTTGKISVKMTPWKSGKYLHPVKDYEYYEFWSRVNVWNPNPIHKPEMDKLQFLEFDVYPNYVLSVPPYWWYSIRFSTDPNNCVCAITYDTIINAVAQLPDWGMYYLQQTNIHTRISPRRTELLKDAGSAAGPDIGAIHYMLLSSHSVDSTNTYASSSLQCSYADATHIPIQHTTPEYTSPAIGELPAQQIGNESATAPSAPPAFTETMPAAPKPIEKKEIITNAGVYHV
jgi:hypothetical protein